MPDKFNLNVYVNTLLRPDWTLTYFKFSIKSSGLNVNFSLYWRHRSRTTRPWDHIAFSFDNSNMFYVLFTFGFGFRRLTVKLLSAWFFLKLTCVIVWSWKNVISWCSTKQINWLKLRTPNIVGKHYHHVVEKLLHYFEINYN